MTQDEANVILKKAVDSIGEHFDSVQIVITYHEGAEDRTHIQALGAGNLFARIGSVREWLMMKDAEGDQRTRNEINEGDKEP